MQWFISKDGEQYGPYSQEELIIHIRDGDISRDHMVWREGFPAWETISQVEELRYLFPPAIPPAPPPPKKRRSFYRFLLIAGYLGSAALLVFNAYLLFTPPARAVSDPTVGDLAPAGTVIADTVVLGNVEIPFDTVYGDDTTGDNRLDRKSYYRNGVLVLASWDTDGYGSYDTWFRFADGDYVDMEIYDRDGDGNIDEILDIGKDEIVLSFRNLSEDELDWNSMLSTVGIYAAPLFIFSTLLAIHGKRRRRG